MLLSLENHEIGMGGMNSRAAMSKDRREGTDVQKNILQEMSVIYRCLPALDLQLCICSACLKKIPVHA